MFTCIFKLDDMRYGNASRDLEDEGTVALALPRLGGWKSKWMGKSGEEGVEFPDGGLRNT